MNAVAREDVLLLVTTEDTPGGAEAHRQNRVISPRHCFGNLLDRITYSLHPAWAKPGLVPYSPAERS